MALRGELPEVREAGKRRCGCTVTVMKCHDTPQGLVIPPEVPRRRRYTSDTLTDLILHHISRDSS